jgi:DNA-binding response OmpR family regulator
MKVLIVEDELMIADILETMLTAGGYTVCGIARTAKEALLMADRENPDLAIIDVRLADGSLGTGVAPVLFAKNIGILYTTASMDALGLLNQHPCLRKPFHLREVKLALDAVMQLRKIRIAPSSPSLFCQ